MESVPNIYHDSHSQSQQHSNQSNEKKKQSQPNLYPRSDSINSFLNNFNPNTAVSSRNNSLNDSNYPSFYLNNIPNSNSIHDYNAMNQNMNQNNLLPPPPIPNQQNQIIQPNQQINGVNNFFYPDLPFNQLRRPSEQLEPFIPSIITKKKRHSVLPSTSIINESSDFDNFLKRDSLISSKSIDLSNLGNLGSISGSIGIGNQNGQLNYNLDEKDRGSIGSISGLLNSLSNERYREISQQQQDHQHQHHQQQQQQHHHQQQQQSQQQQQQAQINRSYPTTLKQDMFQSEPSKSRPSSVGSNQNLSSTQSSKSQTKTRRNAITPKIQEIKEISPTDENEDSQNYKKIKLDKDSQHNNHNQFKHPAAHIQKDENGNVFPYQNINRQNVTPKDLVPTQDIVNSEDGRPLLGATKIDQLMLVIQARDRGISDQIHQSADGSILDDGSIIPQPIELVGGIDKPKSKGLKQHQCHYCLKKFTQSTHLEVHVRSHIGFKPFECTYCHKRFTQGGNLRTHLRLHTGEKPFTCDVCSRSFSRKGNLAAHKLTHENLKPFECKLDGCNKSFTQLGNLKAHQNRFHLDTLIELTKRLADLGPGNEIEKLPTDEKNLLNYFKSLYKNSNRGIRGRGKRGSQSPPVYSSFPNGMNGMNQYN